MDINLWISVLIAIPLAIIANLLTPGIAHRLDRGAKLRQAKRMRQTDEQKSARIQFIKAMLEEAERYAADRALFHEFILGELLKLSFFVSLAVLIIVTTSAIAWLGATGITLNILVVGAQIAMLAGSGVVCHISLNAYNTIGRVHDLHDFKANALASIEDLENS